MPIISDVGSILNLILNLFSKFFKLIVEKPQYLIVLILIALFFPLEIVDMFLYILINISIVLINVVIIVGLILINLIIAIVNGIYTLIIDIINWAVGIVADAVNWLLIKLFWPVNYIINGVNKILVWAGLSKIANVTPTTFGVAPFSTMLIPTLSYSLVLSYFDINIFGSGSIIGISCIFDIFGLSSPVW